VRISNLSLCNYVAIYVYVCIYDIINIIMLSHFHDHCFLYTEHRLEMGLCMQEVMHGIDII
jgi:hypothetical protein